MSGGYYKHTKGLYEHDDHGDLSGIADDDHTQYALLAGRSGGQTLTGGTDASDDLVLTSTGDATLGVIDIQSDLKTDRWLDSGNNLFIGQSVVGAGNLAHAAGSEGWGNTALGYQTLYSITTGSNNTAGGAEAGYSNTTGIGNFAFGASALYYNETGSGNVCLGLTAGFGVTGNSHSNNTLIGNRAGYAITTGGNNVGVGSWSLETITAGSNNMALGIYALQNNATGGNNVAIGFGSGRGSAGNSHANNTFVGMGSGNAITTGGTNAIVGYLAGLLLTTGSSNVFLGAGAGGQETTGANKLFIDNTNTATPLIYGEFDNDFVNINNKLGVALGATAPATSAQVEISSTTGALLLPRMTTTQRDALTAVNGMIIYNSTTAVVESYEGGAWVNT